jgi:hypothetical protein
MRLNEVHQIERQVIALMEQHDVISASQANAARLRCTIVSTVESLSSEPLQRYMDSAEADTIEPTRRSLARQTAPRRENSYVKKHASRPTFLMRSWKFIKNFVASILNFFRSFPPLSWIFPLPAVPENNIHNPESTSRPNTPNSSVHATSITVKPSQQNHSFTNVYRAARNSAPTVVSAPPSEVVTPKKLKRRGNT